MILIAASVCSDYVLATILTIVKNGLSIIQVLVPILLILSGMFQLIKMVLNPDDDKKGKKKLVNSFMSAVIVFFLPTLVNLTMSIISVNGEAGIRSGNSLTQFKLSSCWSAVDKKKKKMDSATTSSSSTIKEEENKKTTTLK